MRTKIGHDVEIKLTKSGSGVIKIDGMEMEVERMTVYFECGKAPKVSFTLPTCSINADLRDAKMEG